MAHLLDDSDLEHLPILCIIEIMVNDSDDKNIYYPLTTEEQLKIKLGGMTVNERLIETNLLIIFEKAIQGKDKIAAQKILESIYLDPDSIQRILNTYSL